MANKANDARVIQVPFGLRVSGFVAVLVAAALSARLIWEQTVLTWRDGPQMVGFSLAHVLGPLFLAIPALWLWMAFLIGVVVVGLIRHRRISRSVWIDLAGAGVVFSTLMAPYGFWQTVFADRLARSAHAASFITYAAGTGDLSTVKALVGNGTPVAIAEPRMGETALHAAAARNRADIVNYLVAQGAPIDALNRSGDSPLEEALHNGSADAAKILESHGAHRIRGTEAQHEKALKDSVREDIERYNLRFPAGGKKGG